ncbi:cobalt-precorrin-6A reductase [Salinarimonas sp.]|uniref:cobalt-precorrin-6A reductase n=1 Tax=Salinarimonas sp. TaxID=2766526 RepID=UPI00391AA4B5
MRILLLGGTSEATALALRLSDIPGVQAILSLAGRTSAPRLPPVPTRIGGFGGAEGLARYLRAERIDALVDATHPFAARISANAAAAARAAGVPLVALVRPPWQAGEGDRWREVSDMGEAARAIGEVPRRVFLTVGRLELDAFRAAPQHFYIVRTIEPIAADALPRLVTIEDRPPFDEAAERALMARERVEVLVTKNSGAAATAPKLAAARVLGVPIILVARPPRPDGVESVESVEAALAWLASHPAAPETLRGV